MFCIKSGMFWGFHSAYQDNGALILNDGLETPLGTSFIKSFHDNFSLYWILRVLRFSRNFVYIEILSICCHSPNVFT